MDSPDGHGRQEHGIMEKDCDRCSDAVYQLEQHCLENLYSNEFFWN